MIEEYNLSFLNLNTIRNTLLRIETASHGLVPKGFSTYNHGMPVLMYPELTGLRNILKQYVRLYCNKYDILPLKFINSWFNISQAGNKLKAHKHEENRRDKRRDRLNSPTHSGRQQRNQPLRSVQCTQ